VNGYTVTREGYEHLKRWCERKEAEDAKAAKPAYDETAELAELRRADKLEPIAAPARTRKPATRLVRYLPANGSVRTFEFAAGQEPPPTIKVLTNGVIGELRRVKEPERRGWDGQPI
jgi:hypothetical protein